MPCTKRVYAIDMASNHLYNINCNINCCSANKLLDSCYYVQLKGRSFLKQYLILGSTN